MPLSLAVHVCMHAWTWMDGSPRGFTVTMTSTTGVSRPHWAAAYTT